MGVELTGGKPLRRSRGIVRAVVTLIAMVIWSVWDLAGDPHTFVELTLAVIGALGSAGAAHGRYEATERVRRVQFPDWTRLR